MRVVAFVNNWVGMRVLDEIKNQGDELVGVVVHPAEKQQHGEAIYAIADALDVPVFLFEKGKTDEFDVWLEEARAEIAVSAFFDYVLAEKILSSFPKGCLNIHPSYLPWGRGSYPNVWSIINREPAGATLHYMDSGIDTGPIVMQSRLEIEVIDTGETLYRRLEQLCVDVFIKGWHALKEKSVNIVHQLPESGSTYRREDVQKVDEIVLDRSYKGFEILNILRSRTFPPYRGAYFKTMRNGKETKVYLSLVLEYEENL